MSSLYSQWQPHTQDGTRNVQRHTDMMCVDQQEAKHSGELDVKPYIFGSESRQQEASAPHVPNELLLPKTQDNDNNNDKKEEQKRDGQIGTWISETTCRIHMVNRYLNILFFAPLSPVVKYHLCNNKERWTNLEWQGTCHRQVSVMQQQREMDKS